MYFMLACTSCVLKRHTERETEEDGAQTNLQRTLEQRKPCLVPGCSSSARNMHMQENVCPQSVLESGHRHLERHSALRLMAVSPEQEEKRTERKKCPASSCCTNTKIPRKGRANEMVQRIKLVPDARSHRVPPPASPTTFQPLPTSPLPASPMNY